MYKVVLSIAILMMGVYFAGFSGSALAEQAESYFVTGKVVEKGTRRPISGASVFIVDHDNLYATTDSEGQFKIVFPEAGAYAVSAVALDFEKSFPTTVILNSEKGNTSELTLYLMPTKLRPIVIQGERNEDRVGKTVISGQELEQVAGSGGDPLKAIQSLPGVTSGHDGSSQPAIRGNRPGDNVYYIDDVQVGYLYHLGGLISVVPPDLVDDFNLFASAFGPQYGDVVGAVIDVGLRNPRTDRMGGIVDVGVLASELLVEGPVNKDQSFYFSARRSYLDLLIGEVENEEEGVSFVVPNYYDYLGKYVWELNDNNRLKFYLNGAGDEIEFAIKEDSEAARNEPVLAGSSFSNLEYHNQSFVWDGKLAAKTSHKFILGHRTTASNSKIGTAFDLDSKTEQYFIREAFRYKRFNRHDITLGGGYQRFKIDIDADGVSGRCTPRDPDLCNDISGQPRASFHDTLNVNAWEAYLKDRWQFIDGITWITGVRFATEDYLNKDFTEPRLGLEWELQKDLLFTMGWGKHHQFPEGRFVLENFGNPNLDHIKSDHYVIGLQSTINKSWLVKSDLYYKTIENLVVADRNPDVNTNQKFINGGSGEAYGLELLVKRNPVDDLSGWLSFTFSKAKRQVDSVGREFPFDYDQPLMVTLVTNYKMSPKLNFGLKWNYHSGSPYTPIVDVTTENDNGTIRYIPISGKTNSERLSPYHRLDLRLDYDWYFNKWKLQTYLEIINVYDRCNVAGYDYSEDYSTKSDVCQLPMLPSFGVQAEF